MSFGTERSFVVGDAGQAVKKSLQCIHGLRLCELALRGAKSAVPYPGTFGSDRGQHFLTLVFPEGEAFLVIANLSLCSFGQLAGGAIKFPLFA